MACRPGAVQWRMVRAPVSDIENRTSEHGRSLSGRPCIAGVQGGEFIHGEGTLHHRFCQVGQGRTIYHHDGPSTIMIYLLPSSATWPAARATIIRDAATHRDWNCWPTCRSTTWRCSGRSALSHRSGPTSTSTTGGRWRSISGCLLSASTLPCTPPPPPAPPAPRRENRRSKWRMTNNRYATAAAG